MRMNNSFDLYKALVIPVLYVCVCVCASAHGGPSPIL